MPEALDMNVLENLVKNKKLAELRAILSTWEIADIAEFIFELDRSDQVLVFRLLPRTISSEVFAYL